MKMQGGGCMWELLSGDKVIGKFDGAEFTALNDALLPYELLYYGDIQDWLRKRSIDLHRTNSRLLRKALRLTGCDEIECVMSVHAATITDNYWVREQGSALEHKQIKFSSDFFSELSLSGRFLEYDFDDVSCITRKHTPELTNTGSYEKCWRLKDGSWVMTKSGTPKELFSELLVYYLGEACGFDMARYRIVDGYIETDDFTGGIYNFDPMYGVVLEEEDYINNWNALCKTDQTFGLCRQFLDIIYLDSLIFNIDRHTFNYGILRDKETGSAVRMAPNFDNNLSLISRGYGKDPCKSSPMLIDMFGSLLRNTGFKYNQPWIDDSKLRELITRATEEFVDSSIDREYVFEFLRHRQNLLSGVIS